MIRQYQKIFLILMMVALAIGLGPTAVLALSAGGVGVTPSPNSSQSRIKNSWFVYEVDPGTTIEDIVRVVNTSSDEMKVNLEGLDAFSTSDGAFALTDDESKNQDIGKWITLTEKKLTLPPKSQIDVKFTVAVPVEAEVGDHMGGITVQKDTTEPEATISAGGAKVSVTTRVGARMYLTVKGNIIRDLQLKGKYWFGRGSKMVFRFKWENNGNVRANLEANGRIYGLFGLYDKQDSFELGQIFPKKTLTSEIIWPGKNRPLLGPYLAILNIQDTFEGLNPANKITSPAQPIRVWMVTFFIPYTQAIILAILLFLAWFGWQINKWIKFIRLAKTPVISHRVKKTDTLQKIAAQYRVAWKLLAQINEIKPPYDLVETKTIYIPDRQGQRRTLPLPNILAYLFAQIRHPAKPAIASGRRRGLDSGSRPASLAESRRGFRVPTTLKLRRAGKPGMTKGTAIQPTSYTIIIQPGDTRKDVEQFTGLSWKEIAKFNRLKPKFRLKAGLELEVPE